MKYKDVLVLCEERKNGIEYINDAKLQSFTIMFKNFKLMILNKKTPGEIYKNHWKGELYQPIIDMIKTCGGKFNEKVLYEKMKENTDRDFKRLVKETIKKYSSMISEKEILKNKESIISESLKIYNDVIKLITNNFNKDETKQKEAALEYVNYLYP